MPSHLMLWLRTVRHFPAAALGHRLRLRFTRKYYRPPQVPSELASEWATYFNALAPNYYPFPASFAQWQFETIPEIQTFTKAQAHTLLQIGQGELLNDRFLLFETLGDLKVALTAHTPLWRENYGYLEFLRPLIYFLQAEASDSPTFAQARDLLETQINLFWQLNLQSQVWSTYGVSRRLLTYVEILPTLTQLSTEFQQSFWAHFYRESLYLVSFLEWDIQGNHLIQNVTTWLAVTMVFQQVPQLKDLGNDWQAQLQTLLPKLFREQTLPDGFHYERTPMYHCWVLRDLLECLVRFNATTLSESVREQLIPVAQRLWQAGATLRHASGQIPLFGDASLPQTPDFSLLTQYAKTLAGLTLPDEVHLAPFQIFPKAGFAIWRLNNPDASLVMDCGDFGPRHLPAHSHCDLASFELHGANGPLIVDSGISEYVNSLMRDYFRGTAAHNTLWFPDEEQAEFWASFRVAEYPRFKGCQIHLSEPEVPSAAEPDSEEPQGSTPAATATISPAQTGVNPDVKLGVAYENYNRHYGHQRSIESVAQRFWVVKDRVQLLAALETGCFSLLHLHPDCQIVPEQDGFIVDNQLLIVPFGAYLVELAEREPWYQNLNLYSSGFNLASPGQLIAFSPDITRAFGWVLIPFANLKPPSWQTDMDVLTVSFADGEVLRVVLT